MFQDTTEVIIVVIVAVLVLRAIAVRKVDGPSGGLGGGSQQPGSQGKPKLRGIDGMADAALRQAVKELVQGGHYIEAVKFVKESKKLGLKEAKSFVDSVKIDAPSDQSTGAKRLVDQKRFSSTEISTRAKHLKEGGHVIDAVKFVKDQTGMDLVAAKRFVDSL